MAMTAMEHDDGIISVSWKVKNQTIISATSAGQIELIQGNNTDLSNYTLLGTSRVVIAGGDRLCLRGYDINARYMYVVNLTSSPITVPANGECIVAKYRKK